MTEKVERTPGPHQGDPGRSLAGYAACGAYVHAHRMTTKDGEIKCRECRAKLGLAPLSRKKRREKVT